MTYLPKIAIYANDDATIDAFARMRLSEPHTIFDSKQIVDSGSLLWDTSGSAGGYAQYTQSLAATRLYVPASGSATVIKQTKRRFNYEPGKSQLILCTFGGSPTPAGIVKRIGYFDDNNGIYFEQSGSDKYVVLRSSSTGVPISNRVSQSIWNIDKLDGTGKSRKILDTTKSQIFFTDFEWLGVGRVRYGFFIDGKPIYVHENNHANASSSVYMSTPNLPVRYYINNNAGTNSAYLEQICSSVISEGGTENIGVLRYQSTAGASITAATENTLYAICGIKLKSAYKDITVNIYNASIQIQGANDLVEWVVLFNPTVAGTFDYIDLDKSAVQFATGSNTSIVTNGIQITGGWLESSGVQAGAAGSLDSLIPDALRLGSKIDGTLDSIVLAVRPVGGSSNVSVEGAMTWRELI